MQLNFKKLLLAGTALVAVSAFGAQAQAATQTLVGSVEWGNAATKVVGAGDGTSAVAGDDAVLSTHTLTVTNDGVNDDGSANLNTFALGTVTATTGVLTITDGSANNLSVTVGSFTSTGAGNFNVTGNDANTANIAVTVTNNAAIGGALAIVNTETSSADTLSMSVGGALSVTGTTAVTAGAFAGATSALTVTGNATFTGATTVTAGAGAGSNATITLNGATNAFTAGLTLTKGAAGSANLKLSGTSAQTVSGNIGGTGIVTIDNASGATFSGTVAADSIVIEKAAGNSSATFQNTVTAPITLGGDATAGNTNTVTFDTTTQGFTVTGAVAGQNGTETNAVVVSGGKTLVQATGWTSNLASLSVSGTSTKLDSNAALTVTNTTIGSGATLDVGAGLLTSTVANSGTLQLTGTGGVSGNITGTGTLDVNEDASVTGNISQGSATIAEGKTLTVVGAAARTVTTNITLEDAASDGTDAKVLFDNGANTTTFTGNITTQIDGEGIVEYAADATSTLAIVGDIGTSTTKVGSLVIGNAAQTFTTTGNLYVNAVTGQDAATMQFLGTSAQTVSGTIADGIITVGNGTTASDVTFGGVVSSVASATVSANAIARLNANFTTDGAYTNTGSTYVGVGSTLTAASLGGTGTLYINMQDDGDGTAEVDGSDSGLVVSAGAVDTSTGNLVINYTGATAAGTYAGIVQGGGGTALDATVTDNSFQYGSAVTLNGTNYDLVVTRTSFTELGTTSNNAALGTMLETISTTTDPQISQAINNIASQSTQEGANEVMESMTPTVDGGHMVAAVGVTNTAFGQMGDRLALLRSGEQTGMAAGNGTMGHRLWVQGFGTTADQDRRDGIDGYEADTFGGSVGLDTETIADNGVVGVAFSYANTEVDSKNANATNTDVDSYQIAIYGDYDLDQTTWLNGMAAYAWNDVSTVRHNVGGIAGLNANGDFDANQYTVQAEVGRDYTYDSMTVAPSFLAHWTHYDPDGYTETGAGGLNQVVDQDSVDVFELGVGVDASWEYVTASGMEFVPSLHAGYRYDLVGDEVEATARFTGAGAAFTTQGADPARSAFNVGGAMKLYTTDSWEFSANYDYNFKSDYDAHAGYLRAGVKF